MKKLIFICSLVLACSFTAAAQDSSKLDIFAGYSYLRLQFPAQGFNANGGSAQVTYNLTPMFGITGDVGGYHIAQGHLGGSGTVFTYLVGPKATLRMGKLEPFAQALFGGGWIGSGVEGLGSASFNGFSMALGGGVDYKLTQRFSLRVVDVDYLLTRFNANNIGGTNDAQSNIRFSTGVVFHF